MCRLALPNCEHIFMTSCRSKASSMEKLISVRFQTFNHSHCLNLDLTSVIHKPTPSRNQRTIRVTKNPANATTIQGVHPGSVRVQFPSMVGWCGPTVPFNCASPIPLDQVKMKENDSVEYVSGYKHKIVFVMGCTATGKSKLAVDLATFLSSEIINSDKIQFYRGLDIVTNKIAESDRLGVPHHLLGIIDDPDADLTAGEFCRRLEETIAEIIGRRRLPIVVGGSNNYIEALVDNPITNFRSRFDCCFVWINVSLPVLYRYIARRVDRMVEVGLVEEVREMFVPGANYSLGIRRAIGVPEMDAYFRAEQNEEAYKEDLLKSAIQEIKDNTCKLALRQLRKIHRLRDERGWGLHRIDATTVFEKSGEDAVDEWMNVVLKPSLAIVGDFLNEDHEQKISSKAIENPIRDWRLQRTLRNFT